MIPETLSLSGFLSYRDPVELDFTAFGLACIAGPNGAGKSSLLDAITWSLFGQARKRDESIINTLCDRAQVTLTFRYEGNLYRVQRTNTRGRSTAVEFHLQTPDESWKPLTERTLRETDARIQSTLRMDYETFVNASFFLQGKADQFTQQRPGDRKRILSSILGLEVWEAYRQQASERRRAIQADIDTLDGRLQEIDVELGEEASRLSQLRQLEDQLDILSKARATQEGRLESLRQIAATLAEQRRLVETLARQLQATEESLADLQTRRKARQEERDQFTQILARAQEIEIAFQSWQEAREELERWETMAAQFHAQEKRRTEPLAEIQAARAHLEAELGTLQDQAERISRDLGDRPELLAQQEGAQARQAGAREQVEQRARLQTALEEAHLRFAEARAENPRLREEMNDLKARIQQLEEVEGVACPTCGQALSSDDRQALIEGLNARGTEMGDRFRANKALLDEYEELVQELESQIQSLESSEEELRAHNRHVDQLNSRLEALDRQEAEWNAQGAPRVQEIEADLQSESYAPEARLQLEGIDAELKAIGYDAARHDAVRQEVAIGRSTEADVRTLETARAALAPIERQISELEEQTLARQAEVAEAQEEHAAAAARLAEAEQGAPDLESAEQELLELQQDENRLRMEVGAARQKVAVLDDLKGRRQALGEDREGLARKVGQYRQLERAFGKDGVPALLIEQALPQIEAKANEVLDRLSAGSMSVRFLTQAEYKDRRRSDLRETLDIQISDSAGLRDYEMYSGGEAFRVNFAIRLALSEVLAQRAGARLQTLVIDEGFGSQDAAGRQRLIEAINMVRADFAKILVITHIDELKDAFPVRIEVEKTPRGSVLQVI